MRPRSRRAPAPPPASRRAGPGARAPPAPGPAPGQQVAEGGIAAKGRRAATRVLTKKPIRPSISGGCGRRRASRPRGRPGRTQRASRAWKPARRAMKSVSSFAPARGRVRAPVSPAPRRTGRRAPPSLPAARPRPVGGQVQSRGARPASRATRRSSASRTSPRSQRRCQAAKSAYWTGSSGKRRGTACGEGRRRAAPARAPGRPSTSRRSTMWWSGAASRWRSAPEPQQSGPEQRTRWRDRRAAGPPPRPPPRLGLPADGPAARGPREGVEARQGGRTTWTGRAARSRKTVRSGLVPADDLVQSARAGPCVERTVGGDRRPGCCRRRCRLELVEEPEPLLREGERRRARLPRHAERRQARRAARRRRAASIRAGEAGDGGRLEQRAQRQLDAEAPRARGRPGAWPAASGRPASKKLSSDAHPLAGPAPRPRCRRAAPRPASAARA